jgi:hypothetical protein
VESDDVPVVLRLYILRMLPFCLYFVAGVVTGFHVYTLLAMALYGVPANPLEFVSLVGSLLLVIAAMISLFRPHAAARVALIGSLLIWSFYGPAIAKLVRTKFDKHSVVSSSHAPRLNPVLSDSR